MPRRGGGFSGPLTRVAVVGIAMGVVVMVMAVSILRGFRGDVTGKVVGFGSHIMVHSIVEGEPIDYNAVLQGLDTLPGVRKVQAYATKGGMVKTDDQIYGIMLRGLENGYDTTFFAKYLVDGKLPGYSSEFGARSSETMQPNSELSTPNSALNEVLVSQTIASKLRLHTGDKMRTYFWQGDSYRARAFTISGIYGTDLTEMDEVYVIGSLATVAKLNDWPEGRVEGLEVLVDDLGRVDMVKNEILSRLPYDMTATTVVERNPALFSWLDLLSSNITLILTIMCIVCAVAIVSALLIMIFEKSHTIGVLKTLGATDVSVRRIFVMRASRLILEGIVVGDVVAWLLCFVQNRWQPLKLDAESYAMSVVPVDMDWRIWALVSVGTLAVCLLALLLPSAYIAKINPAKTVKTE